MTDRDILKLAGAATAIHAVISAAGSDDRRDLEAALALVSDSVEHHGHADWPIIRTWLAAAGDLVQGVIDRHDADGAIP
jgi:hypothetical protein